MLKLVSAFDMEYENVKEYYDSFDKDYNSFREKRSDINCDTIFRISESREDYFRILILGINPNLYYLIDEDNPDYIIGFGNINENDYHIRGLNNGNIAYGIRPNERNKGYGNAILKLLLEKCKEMGMKEVCVSCLKNNISSKNIIIKNGGKLDKEFFDDTSEEYGLKFWIELKPSILTRTRKLK